MVGVRILPCICFALGWIPEPIPEKEAARQVSEHRPAQVVTGPSTLGRWLLGAGACGARLGLSGSQRLGSWRALGRSAAEGLLQRSRAEHAGGRQRGERLQLVAPGKDIDI